MPISTSFAISWKAPSQHDQNDQVILYSVNPSSIFTQVAKQFVSRAGYNQGVLQFEVSQPGYYVAIYQLYVNSQTVATGNFNASGKDHL